MCNLFSTSLSTKGGIKKLYFHLTLKHSVCSIILTILKHDIPLKNVYLPSLLFFLSSSVAVQAQANIYTQSINKPSVNLRGSVQILGELTAAFPADGYVVVHFDGECYAAVGDLIVLAASNNADWEANEGNVSIENSSIRIRKTFFPYPRLSCFEPVVIPITPLARILWNWMGPGWPLYTGHCPLNIFQLRGIYCRCKRICLPWRCDQYNCGEPKDHSCKCTRESSSSI